MSIDFERIKELAYQTANEAAAAAKHLAGTVKTSLDVYTEEERLRGIYQSIGKLYYTASAKAEPLPQEELAELCRQAGETLARIEWIKGGDSQSVQPDAAPYETVTDADFEDL